MVGTAGEASSCRLTLLMFRMGRKTAKTTMRNVMIVLMKTPWLIDVAPAAFAASRDSYGGGAFAPSFRTINRFEKSTLPRRRPIGGIITSATSELTMVPKAAPTIMPTAISTTLPRFHHNLFELFQYLSSSFLFRLFSLSKSKRELQSSYPLKLDFEEEVNEISLCQFFKKNRWGEITSSPTKSQIGLSI